MRRVFILTFIFSLFFVMETFAQVNFDFNAVGVQAGYVKPEDPIESTIGFGARAELGTLMKENVTMGAIVDYWSKNMVKAPVQKSVFLRCFLLRMFIITLLPKALLSLMPVVALDWLLIQVRLLTPIPFLVLAVQHQILKQILSYLVLVVQK